MDPFVVLGVDPGASRAELTAAYRRQAKRFHPDRGGGPASEHRMAEVNVAYDFARAAAGHPSVSATPAPPTVEGPGSWLPDALRTRLGSELLAALVPLEHVGTVVRTATWASPDTLLALTDRRLLWLLDDAPVHRVRSLRYGAIDDVRHRSARLRRGVAAVRVRSTNGQRFTFAELRPASAERIARQVARRAARAPNRVTG